MNEIKKQYIILLDGPKGAGKTTVGRILEQKLEAVFLSFDLEKSLLNKEGQSREQLLEQASKNLIQKTEEMSALQEKSLIIDCGLIESRISEFERLAEKNNIKLIKYFLQAPYETLLNRVELRDQKKDKRTDYTRFKEVYNRINSKGLEDFYVIETSNLKAEQVAEIILLNMLN